MKSVLVVSDFFVGGGLETRILEQVRVYQQQGVKCYLAADEVQGELVEEFDGVLKLPLRAHDCETLISNVDALIGFCREKKVEMIDAQPLYGVIAASFASAVLHLPMTYTLHGKYGIPPADDSLLRWFHIALDLRRPQIVLVADYLREFYTDLLLGKEVKVVRNGVTPVSQERRKPEGHKWVFASRLTEPKLTPLLKAVPVLEKAGVEQLDIFGRGEDEERLMELIETFHNEPGRGLEVRYCGWHDSLMGEILNGGYEGGIGMDRVAVEMMATGLPTMILGYKGLTEGMTAKNFEKMMMENFTSWKKMPEAKAVGGLRKMMESPSMYNVRGLVETELNAGKIWRERLAEMNKLKADPGRDAMLEAVWRDFYENEGKTQEIEKLRAQLEKTLRGRLLKRVKKALR